jgi:hypothetical protein
MTGRFDKEKGVKGNELLAKAAELAQWKVRSERVYSLALWLIRNNHSFWSSSPKYPQRKAHLG